MNKSCNFLINAENLKYFLVSNSLKLHFTNCSLENSCFMNSFFIYGEALDLLQIQKFYLNNNTFSNSILMSIENTMVYDFFDIAIKNNTFTSSQIMNLKFFSYVKQIFKMFVLTNNYFKNDSIFLLFQQNSYSFAEIDSVFKNFYFYSNFYDHSVINISLIYSIGSLNMSDIFFSRNIIKGNILYFNAINSFSQTKIIIDSIAILLTNSDIKYKESIVGSQKQSFIIIEGKFNIKIINGSFFDNICYVGPCGFKFISSGSNSRAYIVLSTFSNNLAIYSNNDDIPSCSFFLEGSLELIMQDIMMANSSINYINEIYEIENGKKGSPCLCSDFSESLLIITNSTFFYNSGYSDSSCILFKGAYLEVLDSSFLKNYAPTNDRIFLFVIDCLNINLVNIRIIGCVGGTIYVDSRNEFVKMRSKNISIIDNESTIYSLFFILQKFDLRFEEMNFSNNICYFFGCLGSFYSIGNIPENQQFYFTNSIFHNNTSIETKISSVFIEIYTMGSYSNFSNCSFLNNLGKGEETYGGIIYISSEIYGYVTFIDCNITNTSANYGGVCFFSLGTLIIYNTLIKNNEARNPNG